MESCDIVLTFAVQILVSCEIKKHIWYENLYSYTVYYRYKEVLLMLLTELLKKIQFRHNQSQLEELDDESLDDDVS